MSDQNKKAYGLPNLFGMTVYGNTAAEKYTPRVRSFFNLFLTLILFQFAVDFWAWSAAGEYALGANSIWRWVLAVAFAVLIFGVDLSFFLTDLREIKTSSRTNGGNRLRTMLGLRLVAMFAIPFLTAIPLELRLFEDEIEQRIANVEKEKIDQIRARAEKVEESRYNDMVAEAKEKLAMDPQTRDPELVKREDALATYAGDINARRAALAAEALRAQQCYECELTGDCSRFPGCPASRARGVGRVAEAKKAAAAEAQARLEAFDQKMAQDPKLSQLRQAVSDRLAQLESNVNKLNTEKDQAMQATQTMDPHLLAQKYGGDWEQSRGFLARHEALSELAAESDTVWYGVWGCRLAMLLFPFVLLIMKFGVPEDVQSYLSVEEQARDGNPLAVRALRGKRPEMLAAFGFDEDHFDLPQNLRQVRGEVAEVMAQFEDKKLKLVKTDEESGLCRSRQEIIGLLRQFWMSTVHPVLMRLEELEGRFGDRGLTLPPWQNTQAIMISDPRRGEEPWDLDSTELEALGWVDPTPTLERADHAQEQLTQGLQHMRRFVNGPWRLRLRALIDEDERMGLSHVRNRMFTFWTESLLDNIERLEVLVDQILRAGREPQWLPQVPSLEQLQELWRVSESRLRAEGWKGEPATSVDHMEWFQPATKPSNGNGDTPNPLEPAPGEFDELTASYRRENPRAINNFN